MVNDLCTRFKAGLTKTLLIMKFTAIFLLAAAMQVSAKGRAQGITLSAKNATLEKVFAEIRKQSGYSLVYTQQMLRGTKNVNVQLQNVSLQKALEECLKHQPLTYSIINNTIVIKPRTPVFTGKEETPLPPPPIDIRGRVVNENGEPVPGTTVTVKGTKNSTATDTDGFFTLKGVDENATLVISGVNIETHEVKVAGKADLGTVNVKIKIAEGEEVLLNTGYQTIAKERATGSFTQIDNKTLNLQVGSNILSRLESVTSSVAFSKKNSLIPAITVRGLSTINGPTAPLIILDNFPFEGDINSINPNLIESITVLKDATAASIWGTRAGNGVIVITTKKGKYGQSFTIDFNATTQVVSKPDLYRTNTISPNDYIDLEQFLYQKGHYANSLNSALRPVISPVIELLDQQSRGLVSAEVANKKIAILRNNDVRSILRNSYYSNALNQQYALYCAGGSNQYSWSVGGGYDRNLSELDDKYERKTLKLESSFNVLKDVKINTSLIYAGINTRTGKDDYGVQDYMYPYSSLDDETGSPISFARNYRATYTDTLGGGKLMSWNFFPTKDYLHNYSTNTTNNLLANLGVQYNLGKNIVIDAKYQYQTEQGKTDFLHDEQSYYARYNVNLFTQISTATGAVTYNMPKGGILDVSNTFLKSNNFRAQLYYSKKIRTHQLTALIGNEIRAVHTTSEYYRTYGFSSETVTGSVTDYKTRFPLITTGEMLMIPGGENIFSDQLRRFVSFFGNAAYNFDNRFSATFSARRDASNLFGVSTNGKWTPLWSIGAGWQLSNEKFYHSNLFPSLRLRATYGYTGNADPSRSGVVTIFTFSNSLLTGGPIYRIRQFPNPQLRWERVAMTNIGIDFRMKNNILSGSLEWYHKKGIDLFANSPVDITTGIGATGVIKNVAKIKGNGIDIVLNTVLPISKFVFSSNIIFNYNTDKVTENYLTNSAGIFYVNDGNAITAIKDQPIHNVISLPWAGLNHNSGDPQGFLNGRVSTDYTALTSTAITINDLQYSGSAMPRFFGSFINRLGWKNLELSINIGYKFSYFFKRTALSYAGLFANDRKSTSDFAYRWQQPGDETSTDIPSLVYPLVSGRDNFYSLSSAVVEKGDHIRIQFINVSYKCLLNKPIGSGDSWRMQIFTNVSNLGIIWRANKKGIDPDYANGMVPKSKAMAIGLKIFFQ